MAIRSLVSNKKGDKKMADRKTIAADQNCKCGCATESGCRCNPCTCKNCNC